MRVLFDTNVLLDVLLDRAPHAETAMRLLSLVDGGVIDGVLAATTITTIHYLAARACGADLAARYLHDLLDMFEVAPVGRDVVEGALRLSLSDYEDAVLHEAGRAVGADGVVTRNIGDFTGGSLPVFSPPELLSAILTAND